MRHPTTKHLKGQKYQSLDIYNSTTTGRINLKMPSVALLALVCLFAALAILLRSLSYVWPPRAGVYPWVTPVKFLLEHVLRYCYIPTEYAPKSILSVPRPATVL
jgi:hypothetical protein